MLKVQQLLTLTWQCRVAICTVCIRLSGNPGTWRSLNPCSWYSQVSTHPH